MARRPLDWIGRSLLAILGLLLLLVVSLLIFRPTLSLEILRPRIEIAATQQLGVPVSIRDLRLRTSLWPTLFVGDLRVATTDALGTQDIARIDSIETEVSLLPLLRHRINIIKVRLEGCEVYLETLLALLDHEQPSDVGDSDWSVVGFRHLESVDLFVHHQTPGGKQYELDLASVVAGVSQTEPLRLEVVGRFNERPLEIEVDGPPIGDLLNPPQVLPVTVSFRLQGLTATTQTRISKGRILIDELEGHLDESPFSGAFELELSAKPPVVSGNLYLERVRASRWTLEDSPDPSASAGPSHDTDLLDRLATIEVPYAILDLIDMRVDLAVDRVEELPLEVDHIRAHLELQQGELELPLSLSVAGAELKATVAIDGDDRISLESDLAGFQLDRLRDFSKNLEPLSGTIRDLHVSAVTTGSSLGDLIEKTELELQIADSKLRLTPPNYERELDLEIGQMTVRRRPDERLRIDLQGSLGGQPLHLITRSQNLLEWEQGKPWPLDLTVKSLSLDSRVSATITPTESTPVIAADFHAGGDRLADLSTWLGISDSLELTFGLAGSVLIGHSESRATISEGRLGRSSFSSEVVRSRQPDDHLRVDIDVAVFDLPELTSFAQTLEDHEISKSHLSLDIPILPKALALPNTDLRLGVERVVHKPKDISDLKVNLKFKEGRFEPSTLSFRAGASEIHGMAQLFWNEEVPSIEIGLGGDHIDLADLIDTELIGQGLSVKADEIDLSFKSQGRTVRRLLSPESDIQATGRGIVAKMPFGDIERGIELNLEEVNIEAPKGQPLSADAVGELNGLAVKLTMKAEPGEGHEFGDDLPVEVVGLFDNVRTGLRGEIIFPLDIEKQQLTLMLSASTLSSFNKLFETNLPDVRPFRFKGSLDPKTTGFEVGIDDLVVGGSDLTGTIVLDTTGERLRAEAVLEAKRIQPGDFLPNYQDVAENSKRGVEPAAEPLGLGDDFDWLRRFDGSLSLEVDEIYWGNETGGGGQIQAQLEAGHLTLNQLQLHQNDAVIDLRTDLFIRDSGLEANLGLRLEDFRYGPIVQALDADAEADGTVEVDTALRLGGSTVEELIASGTGHFDFTIYPHAFGTKVFDLWAAGITSVLKVFNPNQESVLNCVTGRFSIADGVMTADSSYLDTSQIRARGKGTVDLNKNRIYMKFRPQPKRRTFLNLATPVKVSGSLQDPDIRVGLSRLSGNRLSHLHLGHHRLFRGVSAAAAYGWCRHLCGTRTES